ncbi:hypothetical protein T439DRAFT_330450 [Meredithblackwellia eburnea MCA 4105]
MNQVPPPPYDFTDGQAPVTDDKKQADLQVVDSDDEGATGSTSAGGRAVDSGGPPTSFHIYKANTRKCKDDVVMGDDKEVVQYYLRFPAKWSGKWDMTLTRGGPDGAPVASITKSGMKSTLHVRMADGFDTDLKKGGVFSSAFTFASSGDGGSVYKWKPAKMMSSNYVCHNLSNNDTVATWRSTLNARKKEGQLLISQHYNRELEVILTTALAVEEYYREQLEQAAVAAAA